MADSAIAILITNITSLLQSEYVLFQELPKELCEVKLELQSMRSFLQDADGRNLAREGFQTWIAQVRDIAHDAEDIIDEFKFRINKQKRYKGCLIGLIYHAISLPKDIRFKRQMFNQLQEIKRRVQATAERSRRYVLVDDIPEGSYSNNYVERGSNHGESLLFAREDDLVGIKETRSLLIGWLTNKESNRKVISVIGMGGLGKTSVVANAFNTQIVKGHFDCIAWVSVSQGCGKEGLLRKIVMDFFGAQTVEIPDGIGMMPYRKMVEMLINYLQEKRYLLVLDDVWEVNLWADTNIALPDNACGSRIMVTTRRHDVALSFGSGSYVHHLSPLNKSDSWQLFCRKAFVGDQSLHCPPELENIARTIVEKCGGLPLALVSMGGLLCLKRKTALEWKKVSDGISWELSNNPFLDRMKSILLVSFNDLPNCLKHCFIYCGMLPSNYVIKRNKLVHLWIAEGFVEERIGMTIEDVAQSYVEELMCRSMIQAAEKEEAAGPLFQRMKLIKIHDLMRELALSKTRSNGLCSVYDGPDSNQNYSARRLAIHTESNVSVISKSSIDKPRLRSLLVFRVNDIPSSSFPQLLKCLKLLRVLDLSQTSIEYLPENVFSLFNLQYLNLSETRIKRIPNSLGNLQKLQTLDVRHTKVESLPKALIKLQSLRHLLAYRYNDKSYRTFQSLISIRAPRGIWRLENLQTVASIEADWETVNLLKSLKGLRRLEITKVRKGDGPALGNSIQRLECLLNLNIVAICEEELLELESIFPASHLLQELRLCGKLEKLPQGIASVKNLTRLCLRWSRLREDPLPLLQALSNLVFLQLVKAYEGKVLSFQSGWFLRLKELTLWELDHLNYVEIEVGTMPEIQGLEIIACRELKELPQGLGNLQELQQLCLKEMPEELVMSVKNSAILHKQYLNHIPNVRNCYKRVKIGL